MSLARSCEKIVLILVRNDHIQQSSFVAYDQRFFDVIGPNATVEQLQVLPFQVHEAPCYVKETSQLFFVEWGPPGGSENGRHDWQYLLDLETNNLTRIKTDPPTWNVHGCVYREGNMHVVTDGGPDETGYLAIIDPATLKRTTLLNNYFERPFISFNDIELDHEGNYYLTDSRSGFVSNLLLSPQRYPSRVNPSTTESQTRRSMLTQHRDAVSTRSTLRLSRQSTL